MIHAGVLSIMERILSRPNLLKALERVEKNKGSHGVDSSEVSHIPDCLEPSKEFFLDL